MNKRRTGTARLWNTARN